MVTHDLELTIVYKSGALVKIDGVKEFEIQLGQSCKCSWVCHSWAKVRPVIVNADEVAAVYKRHRRIWNPFKLFGVLK